MAFGRFYCSALLLLVVYWIDTGFCFECPGSGFYPDPDQCDAYYECQRNKPAKFKLCLDGMVFQGTNPLYERCDYPFNVDCRDRPRLQPTQSRNKKCPRRNGLFADETSIYCDHYWNCVNGHASSQRCSGNLAFNPASGTCQWPKDVPGCSEADIARREKERSKDSGADNEEKVDSR